MEILQLIFLLVVLVQIFADDPEDLTALPGHLKPFGSGRPGLPVEEFDMFPDPTYFFENYVKKLKPLKMKGAAKFSGAFKKWTDDYFLSLKEPSDSTISVETVKKENRKQGVDSMSFQDFVRLYNNTEHYMVDAVPAFIRDDIMIPCPLQCEQLAENNFVDNVMWFSSGGTKSVVHTDSVDNINCLYRGEKSLVFVDPALHGKNVDLDRPEGAYSAMDVDAVDYTKYPGMAQVEFYHVNVSAGDCLYIPYLWIHQVRSYGSNLAVNIWWKHYIADELNYTTCNDPCDPDFTLDMAHFLGFEGLSESPYETRDHFLSVITEDTDFDTFRKSFLGDEELLLQNEQLGKDLHEVFSLLDLNKDGTLSNQEALDSPIEVYSEIAELLGVMEEDMNAIMEAQGIDIDDNEEIESRGENDDSDEMDLHDEL
ncbi:tRNA wybutosine-synthesizing protein 5-like [Mya arenaria]|uniref:tRNA wybutosine-synthesizing protein 5-like n=1 Tax=Mya arenaria TaxID=6604 RepID=UPI0022E7508C|nr:tRNA wybutosine-synthesizing protein 5-like [Mya arenaria]XP_052808489.1 tRNA wybutosine-synthesizing protein 5-like [Mya arenaria]XP_052808490.1 tRNA wybutosine-synthesizing protein 5-like [Mya arenaria]XP_052808491.1 tRNA wybutosine-synthesizing protein 5-like [Mya arenaria]